jgi:hypothetical protein
MPSKKEFTDMKNKTGSIVGLVIGFLGSIFMGVVAIAIGLGAAYPSINSIAKPFVCPRGDLTFEKNVSQPMPGETYATIQWYCTDSEAGNKAELAYFSLIPYAGVFYGLFVCFPLFLLARYGFQKWDESLDKKYAEERKARNQPSKKRK